MSKFSEFPEVKISIKKDKDCGCDYVLRFYEENDDGEFELDTCYELYLDEYGCVHHAWDGVKRLYPYRWLESYNSYTLEQDLTISQLRYRLNNDHDSIIFR